MVGACGGRTKLGLCVVDRVDVRGLAQALDRWHAESTVGDVSRDRKGLTLRVLVVAPRLEVGGTEVHLARILPRLRRDGLDISLFTISRGGPLDSALAENGVAVLGSEPAG